MMRGALLAGIVVACVAQAGDGPPLRFLQPRARIVFATPRGANFYAQVRVEPHPDNRAYRLTWDGACSGTSSRTLDGDNAPATQPRVLIYSEPGDCVLLARVYGAGDRIRHSLAYTVNVCGGEVPC